MENYNVPELNLDLTFLNVKSQEVSESSRNLEFQLNEKSFKSQQFESHKGFLKNA